MQQRRAEWGHIYTHTSVPFSTDKALALNGPRSQEVGRLFCPRCGNATVEKVEVLTGPDGQEQYGVRRKHVLRGTRFSLPKPKVRLAVDAPWPSDRSAGANCTHAQVSKCPES